jgi:hypothetical protein
MDWRSKEIKYYCPKFDETHFLHGGFSASKYSWMRLSIHVCDDREEAEQQRIHEGKIHTKCASWDESLQFFESTVHGLESISYEASVDEKFSQYLYSGDDNPNKKTFDDLLIQSRRDMSFSSHVSGGIPYFNIGLSSAEIKL